MPDTDETTPTSERQRLEDDRQRRLHAWRRWGPYLSDRQWGTVREDYSASADPWNYFPIHHAHKRAYRWGEDGLAGVSDDNQRLCLALALWNGRDPILKERLFGLANEEGNHGEDVKEHYYHLDATPTHSYLKFLYKYPQARFPYEKLHAANRARGRDVPEYELLDTGIFDQDRYFDVVVEYAKASPYDILMRVTAHNRGPAAAPLHLLPTVWFRNTWSWSEDAFKPFIQVEGLGLSLHQMEADTYRFYAEVATPTRDGQVPVAAVLAANAGRATTNPRFIFTENETNVRDLYGVQKDGYFKDAFHEYLCRGNPDAVNPQQTGTKAAAHYHFSVPAGGSVTVRCRLRHIAEPTVDPFADFEHIFADRIKEADEFYGELQHDMPDDARNVQRQAFAGLIWTKQYYGYEVWRWLKGDPMPPPPPAERKHGRNSDWEHLKNADIISMPDKWEYPWYAAWDLAFHMIPFAVIDPEFAKHQLRLLCREWYMHPNGQLPAYEWNFGDVNPPVHAWAAWRVFQIDRNQRRQVDRNDPGDLDFLERIFHKLMLNFTWWVNRKDAQGRNVFQGGFLGLDNIGVFNRSQPLPTGGHINQSDGTAWMAMYSLNLMRIALELSLHNRAYEDMATKFFEHFLAIAKAMTDMGGRGIGLWDDDDGFYYDELITSDGQMIKLRVRSLVGLIPLFAVEVLEPELLSKVPAFSRRLRWVLDNRPDMASLVSRWFEPRRGERRLLSLLRGSRMKKVLRRMLDETEFLSPHGIRGLSKYHKEHPYVFDAGGTTLGVHYVPGDSDTGMFGGNSNWRGPIWFPVNFLIIESLQKFHHYYGDDFLVECPTGSGKKGTLLQASQELTRRLNSIFLRGPDGRRPVFGDYEKMQKDPHFKDNLLFYEYFHGDTGMGIGASHQTGWTALVAKLLHPRRGERLYDGCLTTGKVTETEANGSAAEKAAAGGLRVGR